MISVAIPTYNRPVYLSKLLRTVPIGERVFISDNGGLTPAEILPNNPQIVLQKHSDVAPIFVNWNRALKMAANSGGYVVMPSDDDLFLPGAFDAIKKVIADFNGPDIVIFGVNYVDENEKIIGGYAPPSLRLCDVGAGFDFLKFDIPARMPGIVFKLSFLERIGYFDERMIITAADSELIQRSLLLGKSVFVPEKIASYRIWLGNLTSTQQATDQWMDDVEYWTGKIADLGKALGSKWQKSERLRYRDEILAQNMNSALRGALKRGNGEQALQLINARRFPWHAKVRTLRTLSLRLARARLMAAFHALRRIVRLDT